MSGKKIEEFLIYIAQAVLEENEVLSLSNS